MMPRTPVRLVALLASAAMALLWLAAWPGTAHACTCQGTSSRSSAAKADAIFLGTVIEKSRVRKPAPGRTDIRFEVSQVFKGSVYRHQLVASPVGADDCGIDPAVSSTWVIFAEERIEGSGDDAVFRLGTRLCSGNLPGPTAPGYLGRGHAPMQGASDREEQAVVADATYTRWFKGAGVTLLALAALAAAGLAVLWRPGRRLG